MMEESFIETFSDVLSFPLIALTIQSDLSFVTKKAITKNHWVFTLQALML